MKKMRILILLFYSLAIVCTAAFIVFEYEDYIKHKYDILVVKTTKGPILADKEGQILYTHNTACDKQCLKSKKIFFYDVMKIPPKLNISDFRVVSLQDGNKHLLFKNKPLFIGGEIEEYKKDSHLVSHWVQLAGNQ